MFTGIVEEIGKIISTKKVKENIHFIIKTSFISELRVDQSIAHNGVCLTIANIVGENYEVVAVKETLDKSNLGLLQKDDSINLERCMKLNDRLDGHLVQGHVDAVAEVLETIDKGGSKEFKFKLTSNEKLIVEKGSVTINGVSLTTYNVNDSNFSVTIVPYTMQYTTFNELKVGDIVNLEFDIIGKYVKKLLSKDFSSN